MFQEDIVDLVKETRSLIKIAGPVDNDYLPLIIQHLVLICAKQQELIEELISSSDTMRIDLDYCLDEES